MFMYFIFTVEASFCPTLNRSVIVFIASAMKQWNNWTMMFSCFDLSFSTESHPEHIYSHATLPISPSRWYLDCCNKLFSPRFQPEFSVFPISAVFRRLTAILLKILAFQANATLYISPLRWYLSCCGRLNKPFLRFIPNVVPNVAQCAKLDEVGCFAVLNLRVSRFNLDSYLNPLF